MKKGRLNLLLPGLLLTVFSMAIHAQPANDNCEDAIAIDMDEVVVFSTIDATTDGPFHPDSPCPTSASDSIFSDIWFVHTATITGELRWSLCGQADFDSRIAVYQAGATCPLTDDDLLDCNEDGPAACTNFESELDFDVVEGETYLLRLGGFGSEEPGAQGTGAFTLEEAPPGPVNDDCSDAIAITLGEDQPVSNNGATTDGPDHPNDQVCFGFNDMTAQNDIWYTFSSPVTGTIEWSTCDQVNWDSRIVVYGPDVDCASASPDNMIACSDATAGCAGFTNILYFDAMEGETYLMRVGGYNGATGSGVFDLLEVTPPEPPANDLCDNPDTSFIMTAQQADDFDFIFQGTVVNSTISDGIIDPSCGDGTGGKFPDVWFKFNTGGLEEIELRYISETPNGGFLLEVLENCDGDTLTGNSCFRYDPENDILLVDTITGLPSEPTDLYIRISGWLFWTPGDFFFQLVGDLPSSTTEVQFPGMVKISPNPVGESLNLEMELFRSSAINIQVVNSLGQIVQFEDAGLSGPGTKRITFGTGDLPPGFYSLIVSSGDAREVMKFIRE